MKTTVTPFLMFTGNAEEAMNFYVSLFPDTASVSEIERYGECDQGKAGTVKRADFILAGQHVICTDSPVEHGFSFTPSFSFFVDCGSRAELESLFAKLSDGGTLMMPLDNYGFSEQFAWVADRYGVSWQLNLPTPA